MVCKYCKKELATTTTICPFCGSATVQVKANAQPVTDYGHYPHNGFDVPPPVHGGYPPYTVIPPQPQADSGPVHPRFQPPQSGYYTQPYNAAPSYMGNTPNVTTANGFVVPNKNDSALIIEIILSLFGIFGVGWLIDGETVPGVLLLVCSFVIYWPLMILGTAFTAGIGLLCLGPLAIGAIILNALLLNNTLKHKAAQFVIVTNPRPIPPQLQ